MPRKRKAEPVDESAISSELPQSRNFQIPGCQVDICSLSEGVPVDQLLSLAFSLASSNPTAKVSFSITVLGDE